MGTMIQFDYEQVFCENQINTTKIKHIKQKQLSDYV